MCNHHDEACERHIGDSPREAHIVVHPTAHGRSKEVPVITRHFTIIFIFLFFKDSYHAYMCYVPATIEYVAKDIFPLTVFETDNKWYFIIICSTMNSDTVLSQSTYIQHKHKTHTNNTYLHVPTRKTYTCTQRHAHIHAVMHTYTHNEILLK